MTGPNNPDGSTLAHRVEGQPASVSVDVHAVVERAAEIAAEEGHPNFITTADVQAAFDEEVAAAEANVEMVRLNEAWLEEHETK